MNDITLVARGAHLDFNQILHCFLPTVDILAQIAIGRNDVHLLGYFSTVQAEYSRQEEMERFDGEGPIYVALMPTDNQGQTDFVGGGR